MLALTTRPEGGKGFRLFVDGELAAELGPGAASLSPIHATGGGELDGLSTGHISLCGRRDRHPMRHFMGRMAAVGFWDHVNNPPLSPCVCPLPFPYPASFPAPSPTPPPLFSLLALTLRILHALISLLSLCSSRLAGLKGFPFLGPCWLHHDVSSNNSAKAANTTAPPSYPLMVPRARTGTDPRTHQGSFRCVSTRPHCHGLCPSSPPWASSASGTAAPGRPSD